MKRYTAMEVVLNAEDPAEAAQRFDNFGRLAAMRHRLLKGQIPAGGPVAKGKTKPASTTELGKGGFKTVLAPKNASASAPDRFVLGKAHEDVATSLMADVVITMALFGQRRTTVYFSRSRRSDGEDLPVGMGRVLVFLPRAEGTDSKNGMKKVVDGARWRGWFADLFHQVRELHFKGFALCDLKPENVLVRKEGEELRASLIDFGLVARPWRAHGGTPHFMVHYQPPARRNDDELAAFGGGGGGAGESLFATVFWSHVSTRNVEQALATHGLGRPELERIIRLFQKAEASLPKGAKRRSARYGDLGTFGTGAMRGRRLGLLGVYTDIAALAQIALEARVVTAENAEAFAHVVLSGFEPSAMVDFVNTLGGPEPSATFPYALLKADGLAARIVANAAVDEAAVVRELKVVHGVSSSDEFDLDADAKKKTGDAVWRDADIAWRALQSIDYIYASGSAAARAEVTDVSALKREVCSRLIDRLAEAKTAEALTRTLRGVLAAALVNTSKVWYTRKTKSANAIRGKVQASAPLRDVLNRYVFTAAPIAADVGEAAFANAIAGACPGVPDVFANHHAGRSRRLLELVAAHFGRGDDSAAVNAGATDATVRQALGSGTVDAQDDIMGLSEALRGEAARLFGNISDEELAAYTEHLAAAYGSRPEYVQLSKAAPPQEIPALPKGKANEKSYAFNFHGYKAKDDDDDDDDD